MGDGQLLLPVPASFGAPVAAPLALQAVRAARGMTQADLARASGVSQATLSKAESGLVLLDGERLLQVSAALRCPPSLLASPLDASRNDACLFHRKRSSTSVSQAKQARAVIALVRLRVEALYSLVPGPPLLLPRLSPSSDGYVTPEDIARQVRRAIAIRNGPIENLAAAVETAGMPVATMPLGGRRLDALSDWPTDGRPVMLINRDAPGDRQRFTVAHELGHAVMHSSPEDASSTRFEEDSLEGEREREADRFAGELLMPAADARVELGKLSGASVAALGSLKAKWKVSRAMLLYRARELGVLTEFQYRRAVTEMSAAGWKTVEPDPLPPELPKALSTALAAACERHGTTAVADRLGALPDLLPDVFSASTA